MSGKTNKTNIKLISEHGKPAENKAGFLAGRPSNSPAKHQTGWKTISSQLKPAKTNKPA